MKQSIRTIVAVVVLQTVLFTSTGHGQSSDSQDADQPETRQAQAVSRSVFQSIEKAQVLIEAEDFNGAIGLLNPLAESGRLSEYELANVYRYIAYCYHSLGNTDAALAVFGKILEIDSIEEAMRKSTLYTMAQLFTMSDQYERSLRLMQQWFVLESNPAPSACIFHAQILYQLGRYPELIDSIEQALNVASARNLEAKEDWYVLLSYAYFQREDYTKVRDISMLLLERWPKKQYWLSLANAYRQLGEEEKFISTYDVANIQGFLKSEAELVTMAQLYLQRDVPYKAARLLDDEMNLGRVRKSGNNYRLLSQSWSLAQEDGRSIKPLRIAADLDAKGNVFARLGTAYFNLGEYRDCVTAIEAGFAKGGLRDPDYAHISMGMCLYNVHEYERALQAFRAAAAIPRSTRTANQWINVILLELKRVEHIVIAETRADQRIKALESRRLESDSS